MYGEKLQQITTVLQSQGGRYMRFFDRVCNGERFPVVVVVSTGHSTIAPLRRSSSPNLSGYHVLAPTCTTSSIDMTRFPFLTGCPWIIVCSRNTVPTAQILPFLPFRKTLSFVDTFGDGFVPVADVLVVVPLLAL